MAGFIWHNQLWQSLKGITKYGRVWKGITSYGRVWRKGAGKQGLQCACRSQEYTMTGRQERDTERQNGDKAGEEGQQAAKKRSAYILAFLLEQIGRLSNAPFLFVRPLEAAGTVSTSYLSSNKLLHYKYSELERHDTCEITTCKMVSYLSLN